jgi:hypothetical protein
MAFIYLTNAITMITVKTVKGNTHCDHNYRWTNASSITTNTHTLLTVKLKYFTIKYTSVCDCTKFSYQCLPLIIYVIKWLSESEQPAMYQHIMTTTRINTSDSGLMLVIIELCWQQCYLYNHKEPWMTRNPSILLPYIVMIN